MVNNGNNANKKYSNGANMIVGNPNNGMRPIRQQQEDYVNSSYY